MYDLRQKYTSHDTAYISVLLKALTPSSEQSDITQSALQNNKGIIFTSKKARHIQLPRSIGNNRCLL